jgi:osmotically-inducible protein OsmY
MRLACCPPSSEGKSFAFPTGTTGEIMTSKAVLLTIGLAFGSIYATPQMQAGSPANQTEPQSSSPDQDRAHRSPDNGGHIDIRNAQNASASDAALERKVRDRLFPNPEFKNLNVEARHGDVVLSGTVDSGEELRKAITIASRVRGVRRVSEKITVRSNTSVAPNKSGPVNTGAGAMAPSTAGSIAGNTEQRSNGKNSTGAIAEPQTTSESAGANSLSGVTPRETAAAQLQNQIQLAITNEPTLANSNINVNVTQDEITLSGSVSNGKERQTAERIAQSYAENRRVTDRLTVNGK